MYCILVCRGETGLSSRSAKAPGESNVWCGDSRPSRHIFTRATLSMTSLLGRTGSILDQSGSIAAPQVSKMRSLSGPISLLLQRSFI